MAQNQMGRWRRERKRPAALAVAVVFALSAPSLEAATSLEPERVVERGGAEEPIATLLEGLVDFEAGVLRSSPSLSPSITLASDGEIQVNSIRLDIDSRRIERVFETDERLALSRGGRPILLTKALEPGLHHIGGVADITAIKSRKSARLAIDLNIEQPADVRGATVLLKVSIGALIDTAHIDAVILRPMSQRHDNWWSRVFTPGNYFIEGSPSDPAVAAARFLRFGRKACSSAALLMYASSASPEPSAYAGELIVALEACGALDRAMQKLSASGPFVPQAVALALAKSLVEHQRIEDAKMLLDRYQQSVPTLLSPESEAIRADIALAERNYGDAAVHLNNIPNVADVESYCRYYNLGISLVLNGRVDQGLTVLDRVASVPAIDPVLARLRDQANLVLGYYFLHRDQGATAATMFERVSSQGPFANRALLGLGSAYLAPAGKEQERVPVGDEIVIGPPPESRGVAGPSDDSNLYKRYALGSFPRVDSGKDSEARLKRAMGPWGELIGRKPVDLAVIEGFVDIAEGLRKLSDAAKAKMYYEHAIGLMEARESGLKGVRDYLRGDAWSSDLLGADIICGRQMPEPDEEWQLKVLPPVSIATFIAGDLAESAVQSALRDARDAQLVACRVFQLRRQTRNDLSAFVLDSADESSPEPRQAALETASSGVVDPNLESLNTRAIAAIEASRHRVVSLLIDRIDNRERQDQAFLGQLHFSLARLAEDGVAVDRAH